MKNLFLAMFLALSGGLWAGTPTDTPTWSPTSTHTPTATQTFTASPTISPTHTTVITPTPIQNIDGQKARVEVWPQDFSKLSLYEPLNSNVTPVANQAQRLNVLGQSAVFLPLSNVAGAQCSFQVPIPGDYKRNPVIWLYATTGVTYSATAMISTIVTQSRMGAALSVSTFASAVTDVGAVIYAGSTNGASNTRFQRVMLPVSGTGSALPSGLYTANRLRPGDTLSVAVLPISGTASSLGICKVELEYEKNPGLNP